MDRDQLTGFIGAGNMATALIKGLLQSGLCVSDQLSAADVSPVALKKMADTFGIKTCSNRQLVGQCNIMVLSVKPQNIKEVIDEIKGDVTADHLLISIAAGIPLKMIHSILGHDVPMIRVMPNTPALVQKGVSALAGGPLVNNGHMAVARSIFGAVGETVEVSEDMMDAITALSGSGPGYVFRIMECMLSAGENIGLDKDTAIGLVIQTFLGAAHLAKESELSLSRLREMVTSPGGTTAAGLSVFERMGLEEMTKKAVMAAYERSLELGKVD
jgi:pyrroline-5-carboxylate reductase